MQLNFYNKSRFFILLVLFWIPCLLLEMNFNIFEKYAPVSEILRTVMICHERRVVTIKSGIMPHFPHVFALWDWLQTDARVVEISTSRGRLPRARNLIIEWGWQIQNKLSCCELLISKVQILKVLKYLSRQTDFISPIIHNQLWLELNIIWDSVWPWLPSESSRSRSCNNLIVFLSWYLTYLYDAGTGTLLLTPVDISHFTD